MNVSETSFAKGPRVLGMLLDNGLSRIEDIAEQTHIPVSSVYRYVHDMVTAGIVENDDGTYQPGERLTQIARVTSWTDQLSRFGLPILSELTAQTGETSILTVRVGHSALVVERAESRHAMRLSFQRGALRVLYAGAAAKVLLAYAPTVVVDQVLAAPMPRLGEHTPTRTVLREQLVEVRDRGYAISYGEVDSHAVGVAVPVFSGTELLAGISVAGPAYRLGQTQARRVLHDTQMAAQALAASLERDAGLRTGTRRTNPPRNDERDTMSAVTFPGYTTPEGAAAQLTNEDLLPTPAEQRRWTWWHFSALWMGMVHNIFNFTWVGGLVALGMSVWQALLVALVGNLIQTVFIGLNGRVGARFGTPFAVWARSVFGVYGANIAAMLRGLVAIGWFGVQSYLAATAMNLLVATAIPAWNGLGHGSFLGMAPNLWISMVVYWILNFLVVQHGMHTVRRFASWAGPAIFVVMLLLLIWVVKEAGGTGTLLAAPALKYHTAGAFFGTAFFPAVALYIAGSWAFMVLNIPDLTRFARTNKGQFWGTMIGLPAASLVYFGMAAVIVSAAQTVFGKLMWNPTDVLQAVGNPALSIFGAVLLVVATISVNIPSNVVSPAYDITNLLAKWITFRRGAYVAMILAFVYMPWKLMENPAALYGVLDNIGVVLGPITGIMLADFYALRRCRLDVDDLYRANGRYRYHAGFSIASIGVLVGSCAFLFAGEFSGPALHWAYAFAWPVGVAVGFVAYDIVGKAMQTCRGTIADGLATAGIEGTDAGYAVAAATQATR